MKRPLSLVVAGIVAAVLSLSATAHPDSHSPQPSSTGAERHTQKAQAPLGASTPTYRCKKCGAPHGGCYYPLCPDCYKKSQQPTRQHTP